MKTKSAKIADYFDRNLVHDFSKEAEKRNRLIADEIKKMKIQFMMSTHYQLAV